MKSEVMSDQRPLECYDCHIPASYKILDNVTNEILQIAAYLHEVRKPLHISSITMWKAIVKLYAVTVMKSFRVEILNCSYLNIMPLFGLHCTESPCQLICFNIDCVS